MTMFAWNAETWSALGVWVTAGIYFALLIFASRQVKEAVRLREQQVRPFVVLDLDAHWMTHLTISNVGTTVARDVVMTFDPPLVSTMSQPWPWERSAMFESGIPSLPPTKTIRVNFDVINQRLDSSLPTRHTAVVTYKAPGGKAFTDTYVLDVDVFRGTVPRAAGVPEIHKELKALRAELSKWTEGSHGLTVFSIDREKQRRRDDRWIGIRQAKEVRQKKGLLAVARHLVVQALDRRGWIDWRQ